MVGSSADLAKDVVDFGKIVGELVLNVAVAEGVVAGKDRVVVQVGVFEKTGDRIETKAGDAFVEPEAHDVVHGFAHFWIAPVEVGLLHVEVMVIVLARRGVEGPCRVTEPGLPVVGRPTILAVPPDVPVALGIIS
jgi:hypothetical protein